MFCVMGAYPDTLAAVNAEFFVDPGFAILHTDCLGGTALEAVDAALAQSLIPVSYTHLTLPTKLEV